jgi:YndJ-like protein
VPRFTLQRFAGHVPDGGLVGALGIVAWLALIALQGSQLGVISSLLAVGPLIVVPLGLASIRPTAVGMCAATPAVIVAIVLRAQSDNVRPVAVIGAAIWMLAAASVSVPMAIRWLIRPPSDRFALNTLLPIAALIELTVAAVWLVAATLQIELLGFSKTIVLLTAVHFHMAGFGACSVAIVRLRGATNESERRWLTWAAVLVLGASPVVAIGHLTFGALELFGGILLTTGVWGLAFFGFRKSRTSSGIVRVLLIIGALAPFAPMLLALHYGLTRVSDIEQVSYQTIAIIHGGLNAFGFLTANLMAALIHPKLGLAPNLR